MEFVGEEEKYSLINKIEQTPNLFILKAVTKFFGMPGLRLGYGVTSNKQIIKNIYEYINIPTFTLPIISPTLASPPNNTV